MLAPESGDEAADRDAGHAHHFRLLAEEGSSWSGNEPNVFFQSRGDGTFDEVGSLLGLDLRADGRGAAAADLDGDGDEDLVLVNRNSPSVQILRNDVSAQGGVLQVALSGATPGAQVTVDCGASRMTKQSTAGSGLLSQSGGPLVFGLGTCRSVTALTIRWPGGVIQEEVGPWAADTRLDVRRDARPIPSPLRPRNWSRGGPTGAAALSAPQPPLTLEGTTGPTHLGPDTGGVVVLNFWATWCSACKIERPDLLALQERFGPRGVRFLAISLDDPSTGRPTADDLAPLAGFETLTGDAGHQRAYAELAGVRPGVAPLTAIVADGVIRHVAVGALNPETMRGTLTSLLGDTE